MIDRRLLAAVPESRKYIAANVALQWLALAANILLVTAVCRLLAALAGGEALPEGGRLLGSFFHVAMNGMAASEKIFRLLDTPRQPRGNLPAPADCTLALEGVDFAYEADRPILRQVSMTCRQGNFTALVGASGCGKSTVAALLTGQRRAGAGQVTLGGVPLDQIDEGELARTVTYLSHNSYLFKGTVRDNLLPAQPTADDAVLWAVLEQVRLADFLRSEAGLDTLLTEKRRQPVGRAVSAFGAGPGTAPRQPGLSL